MWQSNIRTGGYIWLYLNEHSKIPYTTVIFSTQFAKIKL